MGPHREISSAEVWQWRALEPENTLNMHGRGSPRGSGLKNTVQSSSGDYITHNATAPLTATAVRPHSHRGHMLCQLSYWGTPILEIYIFFLKYYSPWLNNPFLKKIFLPTMALISCHRSQFAKRFKCGVKIIADPHWDFVIEDKLNCYLIHLMVE